MADKYVELKDWSNGVITANDGDIIPDNSSSKAWNTAFKKIGQGNAVLGVRSGLQVINSTPISGSYPITRMGLYAYGADDQSFVNYTFLVDSNGVLRYKDTLDSIGPSLVPPSDYPYTVGKAFMGGDYLIDSAVMNNRLFLVNTEGERRSLLNDEYVPFGLVPTAFVVSTNQASGSSSMPAETYDVAITVYNEETGAESSLRTPTPVTLGANERIQVLSIATAEEAALYTHWRIYIRRRTTQSVLYQVQIAEDVGGSPIMTDANIPIGTTTAYVDMSAADIANLIIQAPTVTENNPPSDDIRFLAVYGRRLMAASQRSVFYSQLDKPDAFPPNNEEPIETGEGDQITGIFPFSDELLLVFTQANTYGIFGNDPQTWTVRPIDHTVGCVSHVSTVEFDGKVGWWSEVGPVIFDGQMIVKEGLEKLGKQIVIDDIEGTLAVRNRICGGVMEDTRSVVWFAPDVDESVNTFGLSYNYQMKQWETSRWNPMRVASLADSYDADGNRRLFVGNYAGQMFKFDSSVHNDGVPSGTTEGTFVAAASTVSGITSSGLYATGAGLIERYVTITDSDNRPVGRARIESNTSTTITFAEDVIDLHIGETYTWYIGGPDVRLYSKWFDMDQPFLQKRFDRVYVQAQSEDVPTGVFVSTSVDFSPDDTEAENTVNVGGNTWDSGLWDTAVWSGTVQFKRRLGIWKNSTTLRVAILHFAPNVDLRISKIGVLGRLLSDRFYS